MTTRLTAIIILISAAIIWITVFLVFGFLPLLLSPLGLIATTIWLLVIIWAGLVSLRALAWTFILMGLFSLFFPLVSGIGSAGFLYLILICVGINFTFGVLSATISFFKGKKTLTTEKKKKYN